MSNLRWELDALIRNEAYMKRRFDTVGAKADRSDFGPDFSDKVCTGWSKRQCLMFPDFVKTSHMT